MVTISWHFYFNSMHVNMCIASLLLFPALKRSKTFEDTAVAFPFFKSNNLEPLFPLLPSPTNWSSSAANDYM